MTDFIAYQDVECIYPMSGQYGRAPRALYYFLLLFVIGFRRQDWLTAGAAAFCLTFGGSAAVHALILAPFLSLSKVPLPNGIVQLSNSTTITISPVANDLDSDATLAIVGTGFLIVIPMALWSAQFRRSEAAPILVLWIVLMSLGMIGCMVNLFAINGSASGPLRQHRFCSPGFDDTLPFRANLPFLINESWNDTIWTYFESQDPPFPSCIYTCLGAIQALRQPDDIRVIQFLDIHPPNPLYWGLDIMSAIVYGSVPLTIFFSIIILILRLRGHTSGIDSDLFQSPDRKSKIRNITIWSINIYGKILIPLIFVFFLVWVEWIIWYDLQSESIQQVGQWAPLVGAALVFVSALVGRYWPKSARDWRESHPRSTWSQEGLVFFQRSD